MSLKKGDRVRIILEFDIAIGGNGDTGLTIGFEKPHQYELLEAATPPAHPTATIPYTVRIPVAALGTMTFDVPQAGPYNIWGEIWAPDESHDSFFLTLEGQWAEAVWHAPDGTQVAEWRWQELLQPTLTPGTHALRIRTREDGTFIRALLVTNDLLQVPTRSSDQTPPTAAPTAPTPEPGTPPGPGPSPVPPPAPPSGLGPSVKLWGDPIMQARRESWQANNHPWWQQLKARADATGTPSEAYADLGEFCALAYSITGQQTYLDKWWERTGWTVRGSDRGNDNMRERGPDLGWMYALCRSGLSGDQRMAWVNGFNSWCDDALSSQNAPWDSDWRTGMWVCMRLGLEASQDDNARYAELSIKILPWEAQVKGWCEGYALDGVWIEGSQYNLGTVQFLVMAAAQLDLPWLDAWVSSLGEAVLWDVTPDLQQGVYFGDVQDVHLKLDRRMALLWLLSSLPGSPGARVKQLASDLATLHPSDTWSTRLTPRWALLGDPDRAGEDWRAHAMGATFFRGEGLLIVRDGERQFQALLQPAVNVDHMLGTLGGFSLYESGAYVVPNRVAYDLNSDEWEPENVVLCQGQGSARESRQHVFTHLSPSVCIVTGGTCGYLRYDHVGPRIHEHTRSLAYLRGASPAIVVLDIVRQDAFDQSELFAARQDDYDHYGWLTGLLYSPDSTTIHGQIATWSANGKLWTAEYLLPASGQLLRKDGAVWHQPTVQRSFEVMLCVIGSGVTSTLNGNILTVSRPGLADVRLMMNLSPKPNLTLPGPDERLYEKVGRPDAILPML